MGSITSYLFCTTALPASVVETFLEKSHICDLGNQCFWILILSKDQPSTNEPTKAPVELSENAFLDQSIEDLGSHVLSRIDSATKSGDKLLLPWASKTFAVLDQQSAEDESVIIATHYIPDGTLDDWDKPLPSPRWGSRRVKFERAGDTVASMEWNPHPFFEDDRYRLQPPENGVLIW